MINTNDLRSLSSAKYIRACCLVLLGLVYSFQVNAQTANAGDVWNWMAYQTNGNTVSVVPATSSANAVRDMGWAGTATSSADVGWTGRPSMRNGSGNMFAVDVYAKTPGAKAAKILSAGAKALPWIGAGVMLWELCKEIGFVCAKDAGGEPVITQSISSGTYCVDFQSGYRCVQASSHANACVVGGEQVAAQDSATEVWCKPSWAFVRKVGESTTTTPKTLQELEDAIAAKSGWPSGSKIHDALKESAQATGQKIPVESPVVTGPATSRGTTKTTSNPTAGTTTTTTTTHNHTYQDNRVTNNVTTSVNVTNNGTGQGTTTTTTEETVEEQTECEKNPNSLNCADLDTPEGDIPKTEKRITYAAENLGFGGGSCPANVVQNIGGRSITVVDWVENCGYITTYAKPMILAAASFAALMIIFVGGKLE